MGGRAPRRRPSRRRHAVAGLSPGSPRVRRGRPAAREGSRDASCSRAGPFLRALRDLRVDRDNRRRRRSPPRLFAVGNRADRGIGLLAFRGRRSRRRPAVLRRRSGPETGRCPASVGRVSPRGRTVSRRIFPKIRGPPRRPGPGGRPEDGRRSGGPRGDARRRLVTTARVERVSDGRPPFPGRGIANGGIFRLSPGAPSRPVDAGRPTFEIRAKRKRQGRAGVARCRRTGFGDWRPVQVSRVPKDATVSGRDRPPPAPERSGERRGARTDGRTSPKRSSSRNRAGIHGVPYPAVKCRDGAAKTFNRAIRERIRNEES